MATELVWGLLGWKLVGSRWAGVVIMIVMRRVVGWMGDGE